VQFDFLSPCSLRCCSLSRQTDTDPLVRPTAGIGERWTTDVWAPLEGFMANVVLRYCW
jgi:hypothetical protein